MIVPAKTNRPPRRILRGIGALSLALGLSTASANRSLMAEEAPSQAQSSWASTVRRTLRDGTPSILLVTTQADATQEGWLTRLAASPEIAELTGSWAIGELVVEREPRQAGRLALTSYPSVVVFRRGAAGQLERVATREGAVSPADLSNWIQEISRSIKAAPDSGVVRSQYVSGQTTASSQQPTTPIYTQPVTKMIPAPPPVVRECAPPPAPREVIVERQVVREAPPVRREVIVEREAPAPREVVVERVIEREAPVARRNVLTRPRVVEREAPAPRQVVVEREAPAPRQVVVERVVEREAPAPREVVVERVVEREAPAPREVVVERSVAMREAPAVAVRAVEEEPELRLIEPGPFDRMLGRLGDRLSRRALPRMEVELETQQVYRAARPARTTRVVAPSQARYVVAPREAAVQPPCGAAHAPAVCPAPVQAVAPPPAPTYPTASPQGDAGGGHGFLNGMFGGH